jgi:hypothetical protein
LVEAENAAVIAPDPLEHPIPIQVPTIENGHLRFRSGDEAPANIHAFRH